MCCVYLRDVSLAEDAVQETFLKAYKGLDTFRRDCAEKTWLAHIAINVCRSMRRSAWFRFVDRRVTLDCLPEVIAPAQPDRMALTEEIMRLPRKELEVVLLRCYQGMKGGEVAKALGISQSAVSGRLHRARRHLSAALKGGMDDEA